MTSTYSIKLGNEYIALFDDGRLGFAPDMSRGTALNRKGKRSYLTR
jgi:hypothetical protein